jgi:nucleotide-binding universal stress UspA family protein
LAGEIGTGDRTIVVGVDGSASSKAALRWAARLAQLDGSVVWAVTAWQYPRFYGVETATQAEDIAEAAGAILTATVEEVLGPDPAVEVRESVELGHPAQVLIDAAAHAQLLVIGSRGHGGFAGALLGSVSQHCAHHASCPVVIIRGQS